MFLWLIVPKNSRAFWYTSLAASFNACLWSIRRFIVVASKYGAVNLSLIHWDLFWFLKPGNKVRVKMVPDEKRNKMAKLKWSYSVLCISVPLSLFCHVITTNVNALNWDFVWISNTTTEENNTWFSPFPIVTAAKSLWCMSSTLPF